MPCMCYAMLHIRFCWNYYTIKHSYQQRVIQDRWSPYPGYLIRKYHSRMPIPYCRWSIAHCRVSIARLPIGHCPLPIAYASHPSQLHLLTTTSNSTQVSNWPLISMLAMARRKNIISGRMIKRTYTQDHGTYTHSCRNHIFSGTCLIQKHTHRDPETHIYQHDPAYSSASARAVSSPSSSSYRQ